MRVYICNAFSLSMLDREKQRREPRIPMPIENPVDWLITQEAAGAEVVSAVGHADTSCVFSKLLGRQVKVERRLVKLDSDEVALIGQYIGPRLPEGANTLPEGARIEWWVVC